LNVGYCLTLVRGVAPAEALGVMEAEPLGACTGFGGLIRRQIELFAAAPDAGQGSFLAGAFTVPGDGGDWTVVLHFYGGVGMRAWFLETLSEGSRAVMHSSNGGKPIHLFDWYEDGELRTTFERPRDRAGSTPDDLLPVMEEVWCDIDGESHLDVFDDKANVLALAERLTGVRGSPFGGVTRNHRTSPDHLRGVSQPPAPGMRAVPGRRQPSSRLVT